MDWTLSDGNYPKGYFLPMGQEPWRDERGHFHPSHWGRRHGEAILHWYLDTPKRLENALLPDGTRGRAGSVSRGQLWRRPLNNHNQAWDGRGMWVPIVWRWGKLEIMDSDIRFVDVPDQPAADNSKFTAEITADLRRSEQVRALVRDVEGALAMTDVLRFSEYVRRSDGQLQSFDSCEAANLTVAEIRGFGETQYDLDIASFSIDPRRRDDPDRTALTRNITKSIADLGWERQERAPPEWVLKLASGPRGPRPN